MPDFFRSSPGYTFPSYGSRFPEKRILLQHFGMRICSMKMKSHPEGWAVIGMRMRDSIADLSRKIVMCRFRQAGIEQSSTGALHLDGFESHAIAIKNADTQMGICIFWQRMRDSNPRKRSQSPVCYRYTNPLCGTVILYATFRKSQALFSNFCKFFFLFFRNPAVNQFQSVFHQHIRTQIVPVILCICLFHG